MTIVSFINIFILSLDLKQKKNKRSYILWCSYPYTYL